jgi:hypothetical protein
MMTNEPIERWTTFCATPGPPTFVSNTDEDIRDLMRLRQIKERNDHMPMYVPFQPSTPEQRMREKLAAAKRYLAERGLGRLA